MSLPQNIDQVVLGLERLIHQWKDKPNVVGLLTSYLESIQEVEDIYEQLLTERGVDTAVGVQLDILGKIVGEPRNSRTDDDYRPAILLRVAINTSDGTEPKIVEVLTALAGVPVSLTEVFPAGIIVDVSGVSLADLNSFFGVLDDVVAATVTPSVVASFNLIFDTGDTLGTSGGDRLTVKREATSG